MRMVTHIAFNLGLLTLVSSLFSQFGDALSTSAVVSALSNALIDGVGHEYRGRFPRRTPVSHTLPRSILWSLVSIVPVVVYLAVDHQHLIPLALIQGTLSGPLHMLLDSLTERGIYVRRNGEWRRFALAHFRYDNPALNLAFILTGLLMVWLAGSL
jgi:hypothetical protein